MRSWLRLLVPSDGLIVAMATVAGSGLLGALHGRAVLGLALFGAVVAALAAVVARRLDLILVESVASGLILFGFFGAVAVAFYPAPGAYATFLRGVTAGWADLLSSVPPSATVDEVRALPYAIGWLAATTSFEIERRSRVPGLPLLGAIAGFAIALLFSLEDRLIALVQGGLLITIGLALGTVQQRRLGIERDEDLGTTTVAGRRRRVLGTGLVLAGIAAVAPTLAPYMPGSQARERFDLRDSLEPPWDPLAVPSPLAELKGNLIPENEDDVAFAVRGDSIPTRWALATLAHFDGTVWTVGDSEIGGAAQFVPIDGPTPGPLVQAGEGGTEGLTVQVEIVTLTGTWLPLPGRAARVELVDPSASPGTVRFNQRTGTAAVPAGIDPGLSYSTTVAPWPSFEAAGASDITIGPGSASAGLDAGAPAIDKLAGDLLGGVEKGWPQVDALRTGLVDTGFYLSDERARPGHSWARLGDFAGGEPIYGFEEQYAALAAIIARGAGVPATVVVGYLLEPEQARSGEVEVVRSQASAWIEVQTVERGWVPVDVTPPRDKTPTLTGEGSQREATGATTPPPPPPPLDPTVPQEDRDEPEDDEEAEDEVVAQSGLPVVIAVATGTVLAPIVAVSAAAGIIAGLKLVQTRRRRRRGQPAERIAGAWHEVEDRLEEAHGWRSRTASVGEVASILVENGADRGAVAVLTRTVDGAAFDPSAPAEDQVGVAWESCDSVVAGLRAGPRRRRVTMWVDPLPLLRRRGR